MALENQVTFAEVGNPKRVTQLTENTAAAGAYFLTEKVGESEAKKTSYATVESAVKAKVQSEYLQVLSATPASDKTMSEKLTVEELKKRDAKIVQLEQLSTEQKIQANWTKGGYWSVNLGITQPNPNMYYSNKIPTLPNLTYSYTGDAFGDAGIVFFDKDGIFIGSTTSDVGVKEFTTPDRCAQMGVSHRNTDSTGTTPTITSRDMNRTLGVNRAVRIEKNGYWGINGVYNNDGSYYKTSKRQAVKEGDTVVANIGGSTSVLLIAAFDDTGSILVDKSLKGDGIFTKKRTYTVPNGVFFLEVSTSNITTDYTVEIDTGILGVTKQLDSTIEDIETNFKNIDQSPEWTKGGYISVGIAGELGSIIPNSNMFYSSFLKCSKGQSFYYTGDAFGDAGIVFFKDRVAVGFVNELTNNTFTVNVECDEMRLSDRNTDLSADTTVLQMLSVNNNINFINTKVDVLHSEIKTIEGSTLKSKYSLLNNGIEVLTHNWQLVGNNIQTNIAGLQNAAETTSYTCEDKFTLYARLSSTSSNFEIGIGKIDHTAGTLITLCKDSTGSYIKVFRVYSGTNYVENQSARTTLITPLSSNTEYLIRLTKNINDIIIEVTGEGLYKTVTSSDVAGNGSQWGKASVFTLSGQCKCSGFGFNMPYSKNPRIIAIGDSFIEGNSIIDNKDKRYIALLASRVGDKDVAILGRGGESSSSVSTRFKQQVAWLSKGTYCLIALGTNDTDINTYKNKMQEWVAVCKQAQVIPILVTITPRYDNAGGSIDNSDFNFGTDWVVNFMEPANEWVKSCGELFIDMNKAVTKDGRVWKDGYLLPDKVHPSITGHQAMFERLLIDAPYLF